MDNQNEEILEITDKKETFSLFPQKTPLIKKVYPKSLTLTQETQEEESKTQHLVNTANQSCSNRKRKIDPVHREGLKQIKMEVENLPQSETKVRIKLNPYRIYPNRVKIEAVELARRYGFARVSIQI